jgi:hypothetical protein
MSSALSQLQELLDADGLLMSHADLARDVAASAWADGEAGRDDDADAKRKALRRLGYNDEGNAMCKRCHRRIATQDYRGDVVEALCDDCYDDAQGQP